MSDTTNQSLGAHQTVKGVKVLNVQAASVGEYVGIRPGDRLLRLNGHVIEDVLDYWFYASASRLTIEWWDEQHACVCKRTLRLSPQERLGLELEPFEIRRCNNACVFCFVHQLPRGLRPELYIKDEDYRLSFLYGNYITGTSLTEADLQRITKLKLSPLYFSVHATDEEVRRKLLVNRDPPPILPLLARLIDKGIIIHTQIVLCPGWNDGFVLEKTAEDLATLYPGIQSLAVVPVGLTSHRQRLPQLSPVTAQYAKDFLRKCKDIQRKLKRKIGFPLIFPSDEFYLLAGLQPPSYEEYEEIPQLENGVGMVSAFYHGIEQIVKDLPASLPRRTRIMAITSDLGAKVIRRLADILNAKIQQLELAVCVQTNSLFGPGITVTGLLPGRDFVAAISQHPEFDGYLIPENALRPWDRRFLDDMSLKELQNLAKNKVFVGGSSSQSFVHALLECAFPNP